MAFRNRDVLTSLAAFCSHDVLYTVSQCNHAWRTIVTPLLHDWLHWHQRMGAWMQIVSDKQRNGKRLKPPWSEQELQRLERRLRCRIPAALRDYLKYVSCEFYHKNALSSMLWYQVHRKNFAWVSPNHCRIAAKRNIALFVYMRGARRGHILYNNYAPWVTKKIEPMPFQQWIRPKPNAVVRGGKYWTHFFAFWAHGTRQHSVHVRDALHMQLKGRVHYRRRQPHL